MLLSVEKRQADAVPAPHFDPLAVVFLCELPLASVKVRVGEVEHVPFVIGFLGEAARKETDVPLDLVRLAPSVPHVVDKDHVCTQMSRHSSGKHINVFVRYPPVMKFTIIANNAHVAVHEIDGPLEDGKGVGRAEHGLVKAFPLRGHVGVDEERIVGHAGAPL